MPPTCANSRFKVLPRPSILVMNAGSSSIKTALFDRALSEVLRLEATGIGTGGAVTIAGETQAVSLPDNATALNAIFDALAARGITVADLDATAHRVVHGGTDLTTAQRITPDVIDAVTRCVPLAPLHNPHHLAAIHAVTAIAPDLPQYASFDTAFHATIPPLAHRFALPDLPDLPGLRRYGFHGTSYAALVHALPDQSKTLPRRLLAMHLGNGVSLCAIHNGRSVATTMGYSPLGGLTMGTRAGEIDAGAVLRLVRERGLDAADDVLHRQSGLLGLSGLSSDMRTLEASATPEAHFAVDHFCYWIVRQAGSLIAAMGGIDAIAFTGGIGENSKHVRDSVTAQLRWLGAFPTYIVPAQEELHIAREAKTLLGLRAAQEDHNVA
ncbi:acetate kinase [Sulfitobacter undariae]|uniref:Acetate kinase n=1 Tax=Sulfitobacter undariae TaxID=1563671 RepID=A0A7W6E677_9RHOB|nr:acetate kinase [Sulfitobacter undariae]MBB3992518.1 acetate kinase [Sulfitobacter undariae]